MFIWYISMPGLVFIVITASLWLLHKYPLTTVGDITLLYKKIWDFILIIPCVLSITVTIYALKQRLTINESVAIGAIVNFFAVAISSSLLSLTFQLRYIKKIKLPNRSITLIMLGRAVKEFIVFLVIAIIIGFFISIKI